MKVELIDRYLASVQRELPTADADDICRELKANLLDKLEQQADDLGRPLNDAELVVLLKQAGHPKQVARQFAPLQPLVAAEDMPALWHTLVVVIGVLFVIEVVSASSQLVFGDFNLIRFLLQLAAEMLRQSCFAFSVIVLAFWFSRLKGKTHRYSVEQDWDPAQLPKVTQQWRQIRLSDVFSDLASYLFALVLLTTPWWMATAQQQSLLLSFQPEIQQWLIWFIPVVLVSLLFSLWQLKQGLWSRRMLHYSLALNVCWLLMLCGLASCYPLFDQPVLLVHQALPGWVSLLQLERSLSLALWITALFPAYELLRDLRRLKQWQAND